MVESTARTEQVSRRQTCPCTSEVTRTPVRYEVRSGAGKCTDGWTGCSRSRAATIRMRGAAFKTFKGVELHRCCARGCLTPEASVFCFLCDNVVVNPTRLLAPQLATRFKFCDFNKSGRLSDFLRSKQRPSSDLIDFHPLPFDRVGPGSPPHVERDVGFASRILPPARLEHKAGIDRARKRLKVLENIVLHVVVVQGEGQRAK